MAKSIALWRRNGEEMAKKWRSQSRFGEKESLFGEIESLFGEKNWRSQSLFGEEMAKSIALWRNNWRSQSLFGEENGEEMAKNMAKYYGLNI
jgi:hypothetical protein